MANGEATKNIVSEIVSKLLDSGFRASKENNALIKLGQCCFVVQVFNIEEAHVKQFCDNLKTKTFNFGKNEYAHQCAYEMIFLCSGDTFEKKNEVYECYKDLYISMKKQGMVCDCILLDTETFEFFKIGGGRPLSSDVKICLKELKKDVNIHLSEEEIEEKVKKKKIASVVRRNFGIKNMRALIVIVAINVIVFLSAVILQARGQENIILLQGVQDNEKIFAGEYWRLITAMFLHIDLGHLAGNMLSIIFIGRVVSKFYTKTEMIIIYFFSGLFGNLLSLFFVTGLSLGASGAVMGLGGALIFKMFFSADKKYVRNTGSYISLVLMVVYNLFYGIIVSWTNINNYAHFGGFLMGFFVAFIIERILVTRAKREKI